MRTNAATTQFDEKIGEFSISSTGQVMMIIKYRSSKDIDIQFVDGTIVRHRNYGNFKKGLIKNPNKPCKRKSAVIPNHKKVCHGKTNANYNKKRVGETNMACCGQMMKIINYRSHNDIDVEFEDGTIVTNKEYGNFKKGSIKNPGMHLGETNMACCGQIMKIINYRSCYDIDVEFEDGTIVTNKGYGDFKKGYIGHPVTKNTKTKTVLK